VGDWVILRAPGENMPDQRRQMLKVLPRRTWVSRKIAGRAHKEQVVAANVDTVLIVCAFGGDINPRKIERFVAIAKSGGAKPVLVLNKDDLANEAELAVLSSISHIAGLAQHRIGVKQGRGLEQLAPYVLPRKTLVLIGSSGAGKSSLLNAWLSDESQAVGAVHKSGQGQHTTRTRTLVTLPQKAMVIDTPGVREIGMWDAEVGVSATFSDIVALAQTCHFSNCTHGQEPGCALQTALSDKTLSVARLEAYRTLAKENEAFSKRLQTRRRKPIK
jgi:ribosome biogenesis GTPase